MKKAEDCKQACTNLCRLNVWALLDRTNCTLC